MKTKLPAPPDNLLKSLQDFFRLESSGGLVLMAAAALALLAANSPLAPFYAMFLDLPLEFLDCAISEESDSSVHVEIAEEALDRIRVRRVVFSYVIDIFRRAA